MSNTRRSFIRNVSLSVGGMITFFNSDLRGMLPNLSVLYAENNLIPKYVGFSNITIKGELLKRALRNYDRLESDIYEPYNNFKNPDTGDKPGYGNNEGWPGDKEGRIILGLVLQAQATGREPKYLNEIIALIDDYKNEQGYLGEIQKDIFNEQQLSGHGWLLRGLCEHFLWKKDDVSKRHINDIIQNLALPLIGHYVYYPINPDDRIQQVGLAAGTSQNIVNNWLLSSDIGCAFIFMDGVIQAYQLFPSEKLKKLIDEMVARFLEINLVDIKAQTHATLTAVRGLLRYYDSFRDERILKEARSRYELYRSEGMTENYENFNWFDRPDWTEPCAIVDSFMAAVQLWQFTGETNFLEDAHLIYFNALGHAQRTNGGFGLDNCPGPHDNSLYVKANEAWWCCTMRGGEGMARAIQYNYFVSDDAVFFTFYNDSEATIYLKKGNISFKQSSDYPYRGKVNVVVKDSTVSGQVAFKLFIPSWAINPALLINGRTYKGEVKNGFITVIKQFKKGDKIELIFMNKLVSNNRVNKIKSKAGFYSIMYGPLQLGYEGKNEIKLNSNPEIVRQGEKKWIIKESGQELTPVNHLMEERVNEHSGYEKQILFTDLQ